MATTVCFSELDTLLMRYGAKFTSYRIKSVYKSLDQTVDGGWSIRRRTVCLKGPKELFSKCKLSDLFCNNICSYSNVSNTRTVCNNRRV